MKKLLLKSFFVLTAFSGLITTQTNAQTNLLGQSGFTGLTEIQADCNGGVNYDGNCNNGCPEIRQNPVSGGSIWFRCGSLADVYNDAGNDLGRFKDGGSTPARQLLEGLEVNSVYTITIKAKKAIASSNRKVTLVMKPFDNTNGANLSGWSMAETNANVTVNNATTLATIEGAAYNHTGFTTFKFYYTPTQSNVILQIASTKQGAKGSGIDTYIDDVTMSAEATWTGANSADWAAAANWEPELVPTAVYNVTIPTGTGSNPAISATTAAVANNITTNDVLTIASGGSLIVGGTSTGNVTYNRNLTFTAGNSEGWHLVGSPVVGQAYDDAYATTNNIATSGTKRGIAAYNNSVTSNNWDYLESDDSNSGDFNTAQGYSLKTTATTDVSFTGTINTEDVDKAITVGSGTPFNLISNPFTSYLNSGSFLTTNTSVLTSETIWLWNPTTKNYDAKVTGDSFEVAPGQGFFVSCGTAGNVTFDADNQSHQTDTFLRSASKSEIILNITDGDANRYARIYYNNNATLDFDNGFDGETFSGVANTFDVFTQLIGNNVGKNYQVQALPNSDLASMVIPIGVKAEANKEITLSAEAMNLPSGIKVFLEDRVHNTFTRLDEANATYKITLTEALDGVGRFYVHTTQSALSIDNVALSGVSIFKANAATLRVSGLTQGKASISLFNVLGKQVMSTSFEATASKDISLPKLARGIYFVKVQTATGELSKKIILE